MSKKIHELLRHCEENFEKGNLEYALRCAVSVSVANPNAPEPYAHVTAYRILLTAANNQTATGEPDWYAVLDMKRGSPSHTLANSVTRRCLEIMEILKGQTRISNSVVRVYDLLKKGTAILMDVDKRRAYDQRSGFSLVN